MDKDLYNMNEVPQSDLSHINLVAIENNEVVTSSIKVAEVFGKQHKDVLRAVKSLDISEEFRERNFALMQKSIKISLIYFRNPKKGETCNEFNNQGYEQQTDRSKPGDK